MLLKAKDKKCPGHLHYQGQLLADTQEAGSPTLPGTTAGWYPRSHAISVLLPNLLYDIILQFIDKKRADNQCFFLSNCVTINGNYRCYLLWFVDSGTM